MAYTMNSIFSRYFDITGQTLGYPLALGCFVLRGGRGATDQAYVSVSDGSIKCEIGINSGGSAYARTDNGSTSAEATITGLSTSNYVLLVGSFADASNRAVWCAGSGPNTNTTTVSGSFGSPVVYEIGRDALNASRYMTGRIAEVAIWNTGLVSTYMVWWSAMYSFLSGCNHRAALVGHWTLESGLSSVVAGKTLTAHNGPIINDDRPAIYPRVAA